MSVNVGMVVEQMWQPVPGGSGRYIVEVAARLADQGVRAIGIAARRGAGEPSPNEVGLAIPVLNSALPRRALYAAWDRLGTPSVDRMLGVGSGGGADVVHATTWAIPPTSRPLAVTVHDVAFLRDPDHFTAHGSAYFHRALEITRERADAIIVPSQATADDCIEAGLDASRITVIPHGLSHTPVTDDLACAYAGARVFTFPSIWEGFGLPVLEAMAHGTPVVTSADTCMAEITRDDAGLLVPATDVSALAEALEAAAGSEHDRLAAAGVTRARDYTWEASAAAHAAIYASLAGGR